MVNIGSNIFWFLVTPFLIGLVYFTVIYAMNKEKHTTMSTWVGKTKTRSLVFGLVLGLGSLPVFAALAFYLVPGAGLPGYCSAIVLPMLIGECLALFLPKKGGRWDTWHGIGANVTAGSIVVSALMLLIFGDLSPFSAIVQAIFALYGAGVIVLLIYKRLGKLTLVLEIGFIMLWLVSLITLALAG